MSASEVHERCIARAPGFAVALPTLIAYAAGGPPGAVGEPAAVHGQGVPVDVAALLRVGEESDGPRYILGRGEAGHRGAPLDVRVRVAGRGSIFSIHLRFHPAGA